MPKRHTFNATMIANSEGRRRLHNRIFQPRVEGGKIIQNDDDVDLVGKSRRSGRVYEQASPVADGEIVAAGQAKWQRCKTNCPLLEHERASADGECES